MVVEQVTTLVVEMDCVTQQNATLIGNTATA